MANGEMVVSEKLANPAPLGLAGFGMTTLVLNVVNAEIIDPDSIGVVLALGLFYGGLAQLLAGMWEAKKNNTFGFTAFSSYGVFWIGLGTLIILEENGLVSEVPPEGMSVYLVAWGLFTSYMFVGTLRISVALQVIFGTLSILFFLLAWGQHNETIHQIAGYVGLFTAGAALYTSAGGIINETWGREVLPLGVVRPRAVPRVAVEQRAR
jgi:succinate-acetate transporter protein